ncbi:hypothetical protein MTR_5g045350 [Medicago truncatula]|uniref:Uncharacterized protein n=1 Tax=Medicago truncatula TaxID=3880 RepID=G7JZ23_MEDTR|nr:hypothetical protein MTR_5g045350 [Medicago truncatula]
MRLLSLSLWRSGGARHLLSYSLRSQSLSELSLLKQHIEAQAKELDHRMHRVEELEEKERVANENDVCFVVWLWAVGNLREIEGLMMDIAQEAAAGIGVEQQFVAADYLKVHFAESWNEMHHLLIMELNANCLVDSL